MENLLRYYFLAFYAAGLLVFAFKIVPDSLRVPPVERYAGNAAALQLPAFLVILDLVVAPAIVLILASVNCRSNGYRCARRASCLACTPRSSCPGRRPRLTAFSCRKRSWSKTTNS